MSETSSPIESTKEFNRTPEGWQKLWLTELAAAKKAGRKWQDNAKKITKVYLDERDAERDGAFPYRSARLNLFSANVNTLRAMMFGNVPRCEVTRRYEDANDDAARVAGEMLERVLNHDAGEQFSWAIGQALEDRILVGFGLGRVRYEAEFESIQHDAIYAPITETDPATGEDVQTQVEMAPAYTEERKTFEAAPVDYVNWRDVLWSPARTWDEVRWFGFRSYLTRDQCVKRFGKTIGNTIPLGKQTSKRDSNRGGIENDPWQRAEVWEIWCLEHKSVYWVVEGMAVICDMKQDPLQLKGFFPNPKPMMANVTSGKYEPRADYLLAQDQYDDINELTTRIRMLVRACKVVGAYDKSAPGLQRMLEEACENQLIPVDSWAAFAEKGGMKGCIDWLPIEQVAKVIGILVEQRSGLIEVLFQATGMSDILRGASVPGETATAQSIKSKFASVRVQSQQDAFAAFASDLQQLRAEIMCRHFDDENLVQQSGMDKTPDAEHIPAALQLLRDEFAIFRVKIKAETLQMQDMAALKGEKIEYIGGLAQFLTAAQPVAEKFPESAPVLLELLKWGMAGFKGASTIEGVLDQAIAKIEAAPPQQQPDPEAAKAKAVQAKTQADIQKETIKQKGKQAEIGMNLQADLARINAESKADIVAQQAQAVFDTQAMQREAGLQAASDVITGRNQAPPVPVRRRGPPRPQQ